MEKQKLEILITSAAVVVFLVLLTSAISKRSKKKEPEVPKDIPAAEVAQPVVLETTSPTKLEWGRDPFVKAPEKKEERGTAGLVLEGIIWDETNPQAIINSEIVKVGDQVNGNKVLEIKKDAVIITDGKSEYRLELYGR